MSAKYDIVVPLYNNSDYTIRLLTGIHLYAQDYRLILINNGSKPEDIDKVLLFAVNNRINVHVIHNSKNEGFVKAINQGLKEFLKSGGDYVVLQNNDTEIFSNVYKKMEEAFLQRPSIGIVGPVTSTPLSWQGISNLSKNTKLFTTIDVANLTDPELDCLLYKMYRNQFEAIGGMLAFFCTMLKRRTVEEVGLLNETFGVGFADDDEYCMRAQRKGWELALSIHSYVKHCHRTTFKDLYSTNEIEIMQLNNLKKFKEMRDK